MPGFSSIDRERFKEQVRASTDLAALVTESGVALKPGGGGRLKACCPFHHEKTPSFVVNGDAYHCFGCGAHGDCFSFLMQRDGLTFPEALEALANRAGIEIPKSFSRSSEAAAAAPRDTRERLLAANEFARSAYYKALRDEKVPGAAEARAYLEKRAIPMVAAADWGIGFAPDEWDFLAKAAGHPPVRDLDEAGLLSHNDAGRTYDRFRGRLMFPIRDANGKTVAFSGRILPQRDDGRTGKYVNSPETPVFKKAKVLFGLDRAREAIRSGGGTALLCEGQIDTIRLHLCGFTNAVAPQGTAFTPEQAHILKRYASNVILVLDGDTAGHKAALRDAGILFDVELSPSVVLLPSGEDPDTFLLNAGPDAFRALLEQAISPIRFLLSAFDTTSLQGVTAAKNALFELLAHVQSETLLDYALREAANLLHLSLSALTREMSRARAAAARAARMAQAYRDQAAADAANQAAADLNAAAADEEAALSAAPAEAPTPGDRRPRRPAVGGRAATAGIPAPVLELARFLCAPPRPSSEELGLLRSYVRYDLIQDLACRDVIRAFLEDPAHWREELAASDDDPDAAEALADRLIVEPCPSIPDDQRQRALCDLVAHLWIPHLRELRRAAPTPAERLAIDRDIRLLRAAPPDLSPIARYFDL